MSGAISATLAEHEERILAICDGAVFLMSVQEMDTAVRLGVKLKVMIKLTV